MVAPSFSCVACCPVACAALAPRRRVAASSRIGDGDDDAIEAIAHARRERRPAAPPFLQALLDGEVQDRRRARSASSTATRPSTPSTGAAVARCPTDAEDVVINNRMRARARRRARRAASCLADPTLRSGSPPPRSCRRSRRRRAAADQGRAREGDRPGIKARSTLTRASHRARDRRQGHAARCRPHARRQRPRGDAHAAAGPAGQARRRVRRARRRVRARARQQSLRAIECAACAGASGSALVFTGVSLGSILLLAALGLAITYGLMGVINMAHGELMMIGAYATYVVQNLFRSYVPGAFDWYLLAAIPVAFVVCGAGRHGARAHA